MRQVTGYPASGFLIYSFMAQRRMFSLKVVDTDAFLEMPLSSHALYFHLAMRADDDGFVGNPRKIARMIGTSEDDYKVLVAKRFIVPFESGVCVIKHWLVHNLVRGDRYTPTQWTREKQLLSVDEETRKYSLTEPSTPDVIPHGNQMAPQVRLGKVRLDKETHGVKKNVFLTKDEYKELCERYGRSAIDKLIEEMSTYQANGKKYKDHHAALLNWARRKGIVEERRVTHAPTESETVISPEEQEKIRKRMEEMAAKFKKQV